ncbi:M48 family metallopeptidase [Actinoalloteichus hymeniacidonis]|uniref:Zn-dependent protease with chaperone function n=1 Tax=Actinoalloteichus hymeniacidonis TaxID=340345 RepID=A0AAC9MX71_9PSEU|nr:M48 family metallopeptidase [Actinoalloteichus hymeniacidonis]AOS62025.1 Zn-dependent protease with chaperone function [Actinoalloteichus hymeniacidonis]MBB5909953.1 Zn-dependent protease with chaperone function [Actinoalloteichus hymeniacidonis]
MRGAVRAFLAVLLLILFPIFVLALGIGGTIAGINIGGRGGIYLAIVAVGLMLALGFGLVQALRTRLTPPDGPRLTRQEQPMLWQLVDELAANAQTRPPDEIILVPEINAAVQEDARGLGLQAGRRYMMIGLPLLAGLNVSELRSVLAHELGHYGGGHTRLLAITYRGAETLRRTVGRLDSGPARWILNGYARLYLMVSRSATRSQELQADAYSVAAAGRFTASEALRKIATMDMFWEAYADRFLNLPQLAQRTPDILLGFRFFLDAPENQRIRAEYEPKVLDAESSSVYDSHPTIRKRIAAIQNLPDNPAAPDQRPGWSVIMNPAQVLPAAEGVLYIRGEIGPKAGWDEIARLGCAELAAKNAARLAEAARQSGAAPSGALGEILNAVGRGEMVRLIAPLVREGIDPNEQIDAVRNLLTGLLGAVIVTALISQGRAHHELRWGGPAQVIGPNGPLDVAELVGPAVANPGLVPQFVARLQQLGVPLDFVRLPAPEAAAQQRPNDGQPQLMSVAPGIMAFRKTWDAFVTDIGLLLIPVKMSKLAGQNLSGMMGQGGQALNGRINTLLENGAAGLFARDDGRWVLNQNIVDGEHKKFLTGGGKIKLDFADGTKAEIRTDSDENFEVLLTYFSEVAAQSRQQAGG